MFVGLPSNYRKSVLADVAKAEEHNLEQVVCRNPRSKGQQVPPEAVLQFEIQINRISGVPMETVGRREDVLSRGVRFAICKTNKPATPDQAGNPPEFLGNVTKLHALPRYNQPDLWDITDKDDLDPDRSCFVRCSTSTPYKLDYTR